MQIPPRFDMITDLEPNLLARRPFPVPVHHAFGGNMWRLTDG